MPVAGGFAARFVGSALRTQPDRRLVALVRDGYENAFEEIVRRYGGALTRYATGIAGSRGEDVTQDALSKALLALRRDGNEIELRPWLYRIVRNTALNDLRDNPPSPEALAEAIAGGDDPAEEAERREELADLMHRLRDLPEPQRGAIVMRELEGLSHTQIAAALGLTGGGARQAIYRARQALRNGMGMLLPLPLLRFLVDHGGEAAAGMGSGGAAAASTALGGGAGTGIALKAGVVTAVLAGGVGTGVALQAREHGEATSRTGTAGAAPTLTGNPARPATAAGARLATGGEEGPGAGERVAGRRAGEGAKGRGGGQEDDGGPSDRGGGKGLGGHHGRDRGKERGDDQPGHRGDHRGHGRGGPKGARGAGHAVHHGGSPHPGPVGKGRGGSEDHGHRGRGGPPGSGDSGSQPGPGAGAGPAGTGPGHSPRGHGAQPSPAPGAASPTPPAVSGGAQGRDGSPGHQDRDEDP